MRGNDKAEGGRAGTESIQGVMCCLQACFAAIQSLCLPDGNRKSHFDYPSAMGTVRWKVVPFLYSLSNQMRPPCISTRLLVSFYPRSVHGAFAILVGYERQTSEHIFA